jgi:adhesin/invasin
MTIVSGQGQIVVTNPTTGVPAVTLAPFTVLVTDANGAPVANALVTFTWTSGYGIGYAGSGYGVGSGQIAVVAPTDATGQATTPFLMPPNIGSNPPFAPETITASVAGINSVNFYVTGMVESVGSCGSSACPPSIPFAAYLLKPSSQSAVLTGTAGSTLKGAIEVAVSTSIGTPIPDVALLAYTGTPTLSNATCANPTGGGVALTNALGLATCDLVLNGAAGTLPLTISIGGLVNFPGRTLTVTPGPPTQVNIVRGNNQVGILGTSLPLPFVVQVTDAFKNPLPGVAVNWQVVSGSVMLTAVSTTTDSGGMASATGTPFGIAGNITVVATAGSGSATFKALATVPAAAITSSSGNGQSAQVNLAFGAPLVVQVMDVNGNPASFATVSFSVDSGSALLSSASVTADATGAASITVTAGPTSGPVSIVATSGNASATFSLTVLPLGPSSVVIVNAASFSPDIAPGGLATIEGAALTSTVQGIITNSTQMAGYSVTFGATTAPILALVNQNGSQQINIQVPFEVGPGPNHVVIQTPQGSVTLNNVIVNALAPGIFTSGTVPAGYPQAVASRPDGSIVTAANPAQRGENVTLFATGLGLTLPLPVTNVPGVPGEAVASTVYAGINHSGVAVDSAFYQPGLIGVYAVMIQVPLSTVPGPGQPVSLAVVDANGTGYASPDVYLPIQ